MIDTLNDLRALDDFQKLDGLRRLIKSKGLGAEHTFTVEEFCKECNISTEEGTYFLLQYWVGNGRGGFIDALPQRTVLHKQQHVLRLNPTDFYVQFEQQIVDAHNALVEGIKAYKRDLLHKRLRAWVPLWSLILALIAFVFSLVWTFTAQRSVEKQITDVKHRLTLLEQHNALTK